MHNTCSRIADCWGTKSSSHLAGYLWVLSMFAVLAALEDNRLGLYLVPPFGATLTILLDLPEAPVAQPYALIVGSVAGATIGTLLSLFSRGLVMAIVAAVAAFSVLRLIHAYHPPGVALAMYPLLLHPGLWFPLSVVLPFTVIAAGSAAILSRVVCRWPSYPKPLKPERSSQTP